MKNIIHLFCAGVLLSGLCAGFMGCNDTGGQKQSEVPVGTPPIIASDIPENVSTFFEEYPMIFSDFFNKFDSLDRFDEAGNPLSPCFTINSPEEFREFVLSSVELPNIDFDKYTLVIGQYYSTGGYYLKQMSVDTEPDVMKLNLIIGDTGKGLTMAFWPVVYRLFPKLPLKPIAINYINETI